LLNFHYYPVKLPGKSLTLPFKKNLAKKIQSKTQSQCSEEQDPMQEDQCEDKMQEPTLEELANLLLAFKHTTQQGQTWTNLEQFSQPKPPSMWTRVGTYANKFVSVILALVLTGLLFKEYLINSK
jgi:hypothetical protein